MTPHAVDATSTAGDGRAADRPPTLSVIVTAMNEIGNLAPTVANVLAALSSRFPDFEIIIVDDGSTDGTFELADRLAAENPRIVVHHNGRNRGLADSYRTGIALARKQYTGWVAGNNIVPLQGLHDLYSRVGQVDIVLSYVVTDVRGRVRRLVSRLFTTIVNVLFGVRLRYYTGPCVYRTSALQRLRTTTEGSMVVPEILLRMIKSGQRYVEIPLQPQARTSGRTKTFRLRNVASVAMSLARLFWDIQMLGRRQRRLAEPLELAAREHGTPVVLDNTRSAEHLVEKGR